MNILICDDVEADILTYKNKISALIQKHNVNAKIHTYLSGEEMLFELSGNDFTADAIYLDIFMPRMEGTKVAETLRDVGFDGEIIFLTNSKTHMLQGYDVQAFNYILKDQTTNRKFEEIFTKVVEKIEGKSKTVVTFTCAGENRTVAVGDVKYFSVVDKIVTN